MRDEQTGWIELHAGEFALLWGELGLGDQPTWLGIPHFGRTRAVREQWRASASGSLSGRGLGTVDHPSADLAQLLRAIGTAEQMLELQVDTETTALRGLGASGPHGTAAVARVDTTIRVGPVHQEDLVRTMLEVPPDLGPGTGMSANLPVADFDAACAAGAVDGPSGFVDALSRTGVRREECQMLARALTTRVAGGRLGARVADGNGRWHRAEAVVVWLDAEDGRYALRNDGEWISVTPADHTRLLTMAEEMFATVA